MCTEQHQVCGAQVVASNCLAIRALSSQSSMLTNAAPTILALAPHPFMLANSTAPAILASACLHRSLPPPPLLVCRNANAAHVSWMRRHLVRDGGCRSASAAHACSGQALHLEQSFCFGLYGAAAATLPRGSGGRGVADGARFWTVLGKPKPR